MNCETCQGPAIGSGFFTRIVHENDCRKMTAYRAAFKDVGFQDHYRRCEICKENMVLTHLMCEDCTKERAGAKE